MAKEVQLTEAQRAQFGKLWFIFGNRGKKHTLFNHKLIQGFYEYSEDRREDYKDGHKNMTVKYGKDFADKNSVTEECLEAIDKILNQI